MVDLDIAAARLSRSQAGMTLRRLNRLLEHAGLALTNLGDIEAQTVAGAIATGTHGTGRPVRRARDPGARLGWCSPTARS